MAFTAARCNRHAPGRARYDDRVPLSSIIGHAPIVALLRQATRRGRVPQSLLFAGPEGIGKRAVAIALAQAVNCPRAIDGDACGTCPTCLRIAKGQHSDVVLLDRGGDASIKIKPLRERVLEQVGYRPFEARKRVYIIDPADEMTVEAQDALLKTLEEPPPAVLLMLITAYPDTMLPTIQSRCRRLRFGPLSDGDVARVLVERHAVTPGDARKMAAASGGSVTRALAEDAEEFDGDRDAALGLLSAARSSAVQARLKAAGNFAAHGSKRRDRAALGSRLAIVASMLRDLGALRSPRTVPLANADLEPALRDLTPAFDPARISAAFEAVIQAEASLDRNGSAKLIADWVAVTV